MPLDAPVYWNLSYHSFELVDTIERGKRYDLQMPLPEMLRERVKQYLRQKVADELYTWLSTHKDAIYSTDIDEQEYHTSYAYEMRIVAKIYRLVSLPNVQR